MVGRGRVAEGHAAAAVLAADCLLGGGRRARFVAPHLAPHEGVHGLGEGLREAVGQQFGHDGRIVVAPARNFSASSFSPMPAVRAKQPIQSPSGAMKSASDRFSSPRVWLRSIGRRFSRPFASVTRMSSPSERAGKMPATPCSVSSRSSRMRASRAWASAKTLRASAPFSGGRESRGNAP